MKGNGCRRVKAIVLLGWMSIMVLTVSLHLTSAFSWSLKAITFIIILLISHSCCVHYNPNKSTDVVCSHFKMHFSIENWGICLKITERRGGMKEQKQTGFFWIVMKPKTKPVILGETGDWVSAEEWKWIFWRTIIWVIFLNYHFH